MAVGSRVGCPVGLVGLGLGVGPCPKHPRDQPATAPRQERSGGSRLAGGARSRGAHLLVPPVYVRAYAASVDRIGVRRSEEAAVLLLSLHRAMC